MNITICDNDVLYRESPAIRSRFSDTVNKLLRDKRLAMCGTYVCHTPDEKSPLCFCIGTKNVKRKEFEYHLGRRVII